MADINLLNIQPHQVSRDLRGYSVFFYGDPKTGKTTIATRFPKHLLLAFEKGYNAIPGAMAQPINSWAEFKKVLRQLKDSKVHEQFETVIVDTADIAYDYCTKYICANAKRADGSFGVDNIAEIPFGAGYGMVQKEFDDCLRSIVQMDYGLVMISHSTDKVFVDENGIEYNQIVPTLDKRARNIVARMTDIIGYSRSVTNEDGQISTKLFMRGTPRYMAGSRFKYTPDYIDFNYKSLVEAISNSIDKQMAEDGSEYFTDEKQNIYEVQSLEYDFDDLFAEANKLLNQLIESVDENTFATFYQPRIVQITDRHLGKGNKIANLNRDQSEVLSLVVDDLRELIKLKP